MKNLSQFSFKYRENERPHIRQQQQQHIQTQKAIYTQNEAKHDLFKY